MNYANRSMLLLLTWTAAAGSAAAQDPEPEPLRCDADMQCAPPLACDTEQDELLCYYPDQSCSSDDDCSASFECVAGADFAGECVDCADSADSGDGGVPVCTPVPCEPPPEQCFASLIACEDDADCPADWGCRELTLDFVSPHWPKSALGTLGCVPGGTLQLAEGSYYLGGIQALDGQIFESMPLTAGAVQTDDEVPIRAAATPDEAPAGDGDAAPQSNASSGCSVSPGRGDTLHTSLLLALAGLALSARRRALRRG